MRSKISSCKYSTLKHLYFSLEIFLSLTLRQSVNGVTWWYNLLNDYKSRSVTYCAGIFPQKFWLTMDASHDDVIVILNNFTTWKSSFTTRGEKAQCFIYFQRVKDTEDLAVKSRIITRKMERYTLFCTINIIIFFGFIENNASQFLARNLFRETRFFQPFIYM